MTESSIKEKIHVLECKIVESTVQIELLEKEQRELSVTVKDCGLNSHYRETINKMTSNTSLIKMHKKGRELLRKKFMEQNNFLLHLLNRK